MLKTVAATAVAGLISTAAGADVLECRMKTNAASGGWVTDLYYFEYSPGAAEGRVEDAIIQAEEGTPIKATISEETDKKVVFNWILKVFNQGQNVAMRYRAAYSKGTRAMTIRAFPDSAYSGDFTATGKCSVQ